MSRKLVLSIAIVSSLMPAVAGAEPPQARPHVHKWHGYGFLPGYHQPPSNSVPVYSHRTAGHSSPNYGAAGFAAPGFVAPGFAIPVFSTPGTFPNYGTPRYWYGGSLYYFGNPGFHNGRYNGGSFGPCWTSTPIGMMWNCG
jgi:hypothetical protein